MIFLISFSLALRKCNRGMVLATIWGGICLADGLLLDSFGKRYNLGPPGEWCHRYCMVLDWIASTMYLTVLLSSTLHSSVLHKSVLHCTIRQCTVFHCTALYCIVQYYIARDNIVLICTDYTALISTVLHCTACFTVLYSSALYGIVLLCNVFSSTLYCFL